MPSSQVIDSGAIAVTTGQQLIPTSQLNPNRTGYLHLVQVAAEGAATAIIDIYDSLQTSAAPTGTRLLTITVPTTWTDRVDFGGSLQFVKGLYVVVTGAGAIGHVTWE